MSVYDHFTNFREKYSEMAEEFSKYVVMGAVIECPYGERLSILLPDVSTMTYITYNGFPQISEDSTKKDINVINFGTCKKCNRSCSFEMDLAGKWEGAVPSYTSSDVKVLIKSSELHCKAHAAVITIFICGQKGNFEELLAIIGDPELTNQVRSQVLYMILYSNKEALMDSLDLETDDAFKMYVQRKLEMIRIFGEYEEEYRRRMKEDPYAVIFSHRRENPLFDYIFLNDDEMDALFIQRKHQ